MTERWKQYIAQGVQDAGGPVPFSLAQWGYHFPAFLTIRKALPGGGRVLDIGCGSGIFAALLAHHGYDVVGIDDDSDIVSYARELTEYFHSSARIERADAFDLASFHEQFDLVYSFGVVEHYEPGVTVRLLQEQSRCAPRVLAIVPSRRTRGIRPITDERLYSRRELCRLVRQAGLYVAESVVYGDLPVQSAKTLERVLPKMILRPLKHLLTYGMNVLCLGERR